MHGNPLPFDAEALTAVPNLSVLPLGVFDNMEPVDIFGKFAQRKRFPLELFPDGLIPFVKDQSELIGLDPVCVAAPALAVCAGMIDDRIRIQPKRYDTSWTESARLWVAVLGDPTCGKSPGMSAALAPAKRIAKKQHSANVERERAWAKQCDEAKANGEECPLPPLLERTLVSDTTVEKLADIVSRSEPRGILLERDELSGFLHSMDAYKMGKGEADRAFWLESYNGVARQVDRVQRGSYYIDHLGVTLTGGIQEEVLHDYAKSGNHDGLMQRFLIFPATPKIRGQDRKSDALAKHEYDSLIDWLHELQYPTDETAVVQLSDAAQPVREWFDDQLFILKTALPNKHVVTTLGKWDGTFARLLLIYHCIRCHATNTHPISVPVCREDAVRVARLLYEVLLPATIQFYERLDVSDQNARIAAALILAKGWDSFLPLRDLTQNSTPLRNMTDEQFRGTLHRLELYNWIAPQHDKLSKIGIPRAYQVNPKVHELYAQHAEAERERRAITTKMLAQLGTRE